MAAGSWNSWTQGDIVTNAKFQDIQDSIVFIYASDSAANTALTNKVEGTVYFNTTDDVLKFWDGSAWQELTGLEGILVYYLVIGGGASGGSAQSGNVGGAGGGAGGYRNSYSTETSGGNSSTANVFFAQASTNYSVTIGAGGAAIVASNLPGNKGNNTKFGSVIGYGGGGGAQVLQNGLYGGSGGGAGGASLKIGGDGLEFQGFDGGDTGYSGSPFPTGGGGGASATGGNGSVSAAGAGGNGLSSSITGSAVTRAGGGGGSSFSGTAGAGGTGGGGAGGSGGSGTNATANTGSGGGGASNAGTSGAGGSGIVILRYSDKYTISLGAGLTGSTATDGTDKVTTITAGTDNVSWS